MRHASLQIFLLSAACLVGTGCNHFPGKPGPEPEVPRPQLVLDFKTLFATYCAACHGGAGVGGPAISLANPVYLGIVSESELTTVITHGVHGKLMPAFGVSGGGMLTEEQVQVLVHGIETSWGKPGGLAGTNPPPHQAPAGATSTADGAKVFSASCARCHGENGQGVTSGTAGAMKGSIVDPTYLSLVSDQYLRSVVIAGLPDQGMPDWRGDGNHPLSNDEVTSVVAWVGSHRRAAVSSQTEAQQARPEATHPQGPKQTDTKQGQL